MSDDEGRVKKPKKTAAKKKVESGSDEEEGDKKPKKPAGKKKTGLNEPKEIIGKTPEELEEEVRDLERCSNRQPEFGRMGSLRD